MAERIQATTVEQSSGNVFAESYSGFDEKMPRSFNTKFAKGLSVVINRILKKSEGKLTQTRPRGC